MLHTSYAKHEKQCFAYRHLPMKTVIYLILFGAVAMTQRAQWLTRWQVAQQVWRLNYAVTQATDAKRAFVAANADNENALASYDEGTPEEREQVLIDSGLLSDKAAMCLRDPGALSDAPRYWFRSRSIAVYTSGSAPIPGPSAKISSMGLSMRSKYSTRGQRDRLSAGLQGERADGKP